MEQNNLYPLTRNYIPNTILYRKNQINEINKNILSFKSTKIPFCLLLLGVTGSGKTSTIKNILNNQKGLIYVSGAVDNTPLKLLKSISNNSYKSSMSLKIIIEKFSDKEKLIVIDEIDKINNITELFNNLNTLFRECNISFILMTNDWNIYSKMPEDFKHTLFPKRIEFPSYNSYELIGIMEERLKLVNIDFDEGIKKAICCLGAKSGSARDVLDVTLKCIMNNTFTMEFITKEWGRCREQEVLNNFAKSLSETEKDVLKLLIQLLPENIELSIPQIINFINKDKLMVSQGRLSQIITSFCDYGILKNKYENKGRKGGRYRIISFYSIDLYNTLLDLLYKT